MITLTNMCAGYATPQGFVSAVDDMSLEIPSHGILGIAGESGCGKSTVLKLLYGNFYGGLSIRSGTLAARFRNRETGAEEHYAADELSRLWWDRISYIPQGSMSVLNPIMRVEAQFLDSLPDRLARRPKRQLLNDINAFLADMGLPDGVLRAYPHQLSGGMRQRVLVAMAAFPRPDLILADEPTTALDVGVQKKILLLIRRVQRQQKSTLVIVSHDLGVHYQITDYLAVAYAGKIVEHGPTETIFDKPSHPYTKALIDALPSIGDRIERVGLPGRPPDLRTPPPGCRFHPRCEMAADICAAKTPEMRCVDNRRVACHLAR